MATASKLLYDPSPEANEVVAVLRDVLFASFPRHPFGGDLAAHYARTYQSGGPSIDDGRPVNPGEEALSVLEFDAYVACLLKRAPKISKTELSLVYGWKAEHVVDALAKMRTQVRTPCFFASAKHRADFQVVEEQRVCVAGILRVAGRVANIHALRIVSQLQRLDIPSATRDLKRVRKMFSNAWDVTEPSESTILAGYQAVLAAQSLRKTPTRASLAGTCSIAHKQAGGVPIDTDSIPIGPHVGVVPLTIEACLLEEATRLCTGVEDPIAVELLATAQRRFLAWLRPFIGQALLLSTLDLASTWVELVTEAATQHAAGSGPLSDIGLTWNDLATLRKSLKRSSEIFAQSSKQEDALANAFAAMSVGDQVPKAGATAMEMVNGALMEIETLS
ncbi:GTP-binding protein rho2 [Pseudohyphozyma bogoriensis]|nr:GTP-binding protein rho2 [Pseudohyphozyma bogoriensis]